MTYVTDTHPLVWFLDKDPRLSTGAKAGFLDPAASVVIPTIVLAEISYLHARGRLRVDLARVLSQAAVSSWAVHPVGQTVVEHMPTTLDIHDGIIVATAIVRRDIMGEHTALITKDAQITASGLLQVVW